MRYLLDLCVFAETLRVHPDDRVLAWLKRAEPAGLGVAAVVMGELHELAAARAPGLAKNLLNDWVRDLVEAFGGAILPFDAAAAEVYGRLRALDQGRLFGPAEAQTLATAQAHGLILATRDAGRLSRWGGAVIDPWAAA